MFYYNIVESEFLKMKHHRMPLRSNICHNYHNYSNLISFSVRSKN